MSERPTSVRVFKDINYTVSMSLGDNDCYVDFTAYGVTGFDADTDRPNYWPIGAVSAWPSTHEIAEARTRNVLRWRAGEARSTGAATCQARRAGERRP